MALQHQSMLCSLPVELLIQILSLTHPTGLVTCRAVCTLLLKLIEETMVLQYHIELYSDGMIDGRDCPLTVVERLSRLRHRRQAWKNLKWSRRETPMIPGSWSAYELVDGIFSKTLNSASGILFTALPSRDAPGSLTTIDDLGITFRDFAMDPTQDLIVYMQCNPVYIGPSVGHTNVALLFRTMSDNKAHPLTRRPSVDLVVANEVRGAVIQTVNAIVGFMSWDNTCSQLFIYDWRRGDLLVMENHLGPLDDFAFLSDRAYVLTSPIPDPCFRVFTFNAKPKRFAPTLRATLRLPALHDAASVALLSIHTGPFTTTFQQSRGRPKPFMNAPHCRIHIANVELLDDHGPAGTCLIVIHNRTLLSFVSEAEPVDVVWDDWGPDNTRWLLGGTGSSWLRYVHGERLVRLQAHVDNGPRRLEVYDFGAPRVPYSWLTAEEHASMHQTQTIVFDTVFTAPILSRLPCRTLIKEGAFPYSGFMIDDERLIGLRRHWTHTESVDVYTF